MINSIHHISMKCKNDSEYERVKHFYIDTLQLEILLECEACLLLSTNGGIVEVFRNGEEDLKKGVIRHFAFATDDVRKCVEAVKNAGYEVFVEPKQVKIGGLEKYKATVAFCYGPLGEEVEFFCQEW